MFYMFLCVGDKIWYQYQYRICVGTCSNTKGMHSSYRSDSTIRIHHWCYIGHLWPTCCPQIGHRRPQNEFHVISEFKSEKSRNFVSYQTAGNIKMKSFSQSLSTEIAPGYSLTIWTGHLTYSLPFSHMYMQIKVYYHAIVLSFWFCRRHRWHWWHIGDKPSDLYLPLVIFDR